jgi:enoyl-CoA hydratase/carnithine racemase
MLEFKVTDRVGAMVIKRPEAGNALTAEMVRQLGRIIADAANDVDILTLAGDGADFSMGRDRHEPRSGTPFDNFRVVSDLNKAVAAFPGIVIAAVRGRASGLGVGLTMRSDIAIAATDARFSLDEVAHGIPPMFIMEALAEHVPAKHALDIVLSGREFGAEEALNMGIVSRVVALNRFDEVVDGYVAALRGRDRNVVLSCKRYLQSVKKMPADARPAFALVEQTQFALSKH